MTERSGNVLVLGIGNVLMGDEGVGVHVVRHLEKVGCSAREWSFSMAALAASCCWIP